MITGSIKYTSNESWRESRIINESIDLSHASTLVRFQVLIGEAQCPFRFQMIVEYKECTIKRAKDRGDVLYLRLAVIHTPPVALAHEFCNVILSARPTKGIHVENSVRIAVNVHKVTASLRRVIAPACIEHNLESFRSCQMLRDHVGRECTIIGIAPTTERHAKKRIKKSDRGPFFGIHFMLQQGL